MKLNFTQLGFFLVAMIGFVGLQAQTYNTLIITADGQDYNFPFGNAAFGVNDGPAISGPLAIAEDGQEADSDDDGDFGTIDDACESITTDVSGAFALIERGECFFGTKAENAEAAGAIAAIICNNTAGGAENDDELLAPGLGGGGEGSATTIPTIGASINTCNEIKMLMSAGTVTAALSYTPPETIWGGNGEGSFDGGIGDFTVYKGATQQVTGTDLADGTWVWQPTGQITGGAFGDGTVTSPTANNGIMAFNADLYDNAGTGVAGTGVCPNGANNTQFCEGLLQSPSIDLASLAPDGAVLSFFSGARQFNSEYYVFLSDDGGANWRDTITINRDLVTNAAGSTSEVIVSLCGYEDATDFTFGIFYRGAYYYWGVDDFTIQNLTPNIVDLDIANDWFSGALQFRTPPSQTDVIPFVLDLDNNGPGDAIDVSVEIEVLNRTSSTVVHEATMDYPDVPCVGSDDNRFHPDLYDIPRDVVAEYQVTYTATGAKEDRDVPNSTNGSVFQVLGNTFARVLPESEAGGDYLSAISVPNEPFTSFGNAYYLPNGAGYEATTVTIGVGNEEVAFGNVEVVLYKWIDLDSDGACEGTERERVGFASRIIGGTEVPNHRFIEFELENPIDDTAPVLLENETQYVVMAHLQPLDPTADQYNWLAADASQSGSFSFGCANFAFSCPYGNPEAGPYLDNNGNMLCDPGETAFGIRRYTSMLGVGVQGDEEERVFTSGISGNWTNFLSLEIAENSTNTEDLNNNINVSVYPNPAANTAFVEFEMNTVSPKVQIDVVDITGKQIMTLTRANVSNTTVELDVSTLDSGLYHVNIRTEDGFVSKKLVVQND